MIRDISLVYGCTWLQEEEIAVANVTALTCWFTECVATATPSRPTWPSCSPALAVTRFTEGRTGRSVKKFARIARRYRAV